jgi:NitT/TauT family transport system permease protein
MRRLAARLGRRSPHDHDGYQPRGHRDGARTAAGRRPLQPAPALGHRTTGRGDHGLWKVAADGEWVNRLLLPDPVMVWDALKLGLGGPWWTHIATTLNETAQGFIIGTVFGVVIGAVFAFVPFINTVLYPYVIGVMSFPKIAIAPLLVVALGYGNGPKVATAALLAFFPVMTAVTAGLSDVNPDEHNLMRSMGASRLQQFTRLRLPNAMSYIIPSLDVALVLALLGAVAAELVGAKKGMGYLLIDRQAFGDIPSIYAVLIVLALMGMLLHLLTTVLSRTLPRKVFPR